MIRQCTEPEDISRDIQAKYVQSAYLSDIKEINMAIIISSHDVISILSPTTSV